MARRFKAKQLALVVAPSDTTAPTVPTNVAASAITSSGFTVSWTASTDAVGVTGYDVQIDGTSYATPTGTSVNVTGRVVSTSYSVRVRARDAAGNWSALSTAITPTTLAAAPVAAFTANPVSGSVPLAVQFTSTSTGVPTSYAWTFGDGGTSTLANPSHTYSGAGTFTVALTVTNTGGSNTQTRTNYLSATVATATTVTLFSTQTPTTPDASDGQGTTLSTRFTSDVNGSITGVRFYRATTSPTSVIGLLYSDAGTELARATFGTLTAGWNTVSFATPVAITSDAFYRVAYWTNAPYVASTDFFTTPVVNGHLTGTGGFFGYGASPISGAGQFANGSYFADPVFSYVPAAATVPSVPAAPSVTPSDASVLVSWVAPSSNGSPITGYSVQNVNSGAVTTVGTVTSTTISGLTNGTAYTFKVLASNAVGSSAYSPASASATPVASTGYPDASTTGSKVTMTAYTGSTNLNTNGVTLDGITLTGQFTVNANNVTIKNSKITCNSTYGILVWGSNFNLIDCTIVGAAGQCCIAGYSDQGGGDIHILRCDMSGSPDLVRMGGNGSTVNDSYFHDVFGPSNGNPDAHNDTVGVLPGVLNTTINHNTILNAESQTSAVELGDTRSTQTSGTLSNNLLAGAGYTVYAMASSGGIGWTVSNNKFSTRYYPNSGQFGPVTDFTVGGANVWSGNTWADGPNVGQAVNP